MMKKFPRSRTLMRLAAPIAGAVIATTAVSGSAHADTIIGQACRGWFVTGHAGVQLNPCGTASYEQSLPLWTNVDSYAYVTSPSTDVRVYIETGVMYNGTIDWNSNSIASTVVGPNAYNVRIDSNYNLSYYELSGCIYVRVWATDSGNTFAWDVESPAINCP
jgi:hypothetical protein